MRVRTLLLTLVCLLPALVAVAQDGERGSATALSCCLPGRDRAPGRDSAGAVRVWMRGVFEGHTNQSAPISASLLHRVGSYYDGGYHGWSLTVGLRAGARLLSEIGWNRDDITLPGGKFRNDLVPVKVSYAFTSLASLQGLVQYNRQASTFSSNRRLALLNRSGTGFFLVCNDRRDTSSFTPEELLGRSFVAKYMRLFRF